jgi:dihydroorotase-like cyclic amidohydrolase
VLNQELPALFADGCTSFKVFMTYDDLVLSDRQLLEVFEVARREQALVMVHCRGLRQHPLPDRAAGGGRQDRALLPRPARGRR